MRKIKKIVITHQYYRAVWTSVVEGEILEILELYWKAEAVQKIDGWSDVKT